MAQNAAHTDNDKSSDWFLFGGGRHRCPGDNLAKEEIMQFASILLQNYTFTTEQKNAKMVTHVTTMLDKSIEITLEPR